MEIFHFFYFMIKYLFMYCLGLSPVEKQEIIPYLCVIDNSPEKIATLYD